MERPPYSGKWSLKVPFPPEKLRTWLLSVLTKEHGREIDNRVVGDVRADRGDRPAIEAEPTVDRASKKNGCDVDWHDTAFHQMTQRKQGARHFYA